MIRRYRTAIQAGAITDYVEATVEAASLASLVDLQVASADAAALDRRMEALGYEFAEADPASTLPGFIMASPNGEKWAVTINNAGVMAAVLEVT